MAEPKLRFTKENGERYPDLIHLTMGDIYTERNERGNPSLPVLTVSIHSGVSDGELDEDELGKRVKRSSDLSQYKKAVTGDLVFNMMRAWQGAVGCVKTTGLTSPAYIVARPNERIYPPYMDYYVQTKNVIDKFNRLSYGALDFRKRLYWDSFITADINIPVLEEQKKIADFLTTVDDVIAISEAEMANLEIQKKTVMKKIFAQEVRFTNPDGSMFPDWIEMAIRDLGNIHGGLSGKTKEDFGLGDSSFITYMNVYKNSFAQNDMVEKVDIKKNERQFLIQYGDIMFTQSSETVEEVGLSSVWLYQEEVYLNSFCMVLRPNNLTNIIPEFSGYLFRSHEVRKQIMLQGQGATRVNLAPSRLQNVKVKYPVSQKEQHLIANFLSDFDEAIASAKKELDLWKRLKKGLLQQLFV